MKKAEFAAYEQPQTWTEQSSGSGVAYFKSKEQTTQFS